MRKVFFLQLSYDHLAFHIIPIAAHLSQFSGYEVTVGTYLSSIPITEKLLKFYPEHKVKIMELDVSLKRKILDINKAGLPRIKYIFLENRLVIEQNDLLVSPTIKLNRVKSLFNNPDLKMVYTSHGAGDYEDGFDESLNEYEWWLLSGRKITDRLKELNRKPKYGCSIVGYPKFDFLKKREKINLFGNENPIILYNPHFREELSSYYSWGLSVLDFFYNNPQYNLIFAPHIMLFKERAKLKRIPKKYFDAPNIHIDVSSERLVDMTYVQTADLYLGDVSSQVYEFLQEKRPCLFLNVNQVDWKENKSYTHWCFGEVVNDIEELPEALLRAFKNHSKYLPIQEKLFNETFELTEEPSGLRAARQIDVFLKEYNS
jgi:hypothetical protein